MKLILIKDHLLREPLQKSLEETEFLVLVTDSTEKAVEVYDLLAN